MDDVYKISLLIDFYGQLLTERQYEVLDLYHNNDYSLSEIAKALNISRQGVYDNLKRGKNALLQLEAKLKLVEKFTKNRVTAVKILQIMDKIDIGNLVLVDQENFAEIKKGIKEIIKNV